MQRQKILSLIVFLSLFVLIPLFSFVKKLLKVIVSFSQRTKIIITMLPFLIL